jgi:ATP-dependent DNA helicase RecG
LGLIIVDEQHRFGVKQRQELYNNAGHMPHILSMTATPIPRSLALTVYGELDISIIKQAPSSKAGVDTKLISPNSTNQMYESIKNQLDAKRQAYIVCPLITESEILNYASAEETYKKLSQKELKNYKVGLIHGGLPASQKEQIMQSFKLGQLDALVATTVIEVGVDVPNATEMVILGADRFGLAQLHQIRGRVGRGEHKGTCYLVMSDSAKPSRRMQAIASTNNGFELAEYDLEIRGPGAIYGTRQHGELDLRFVSLTDTILISEVRQAVNEFIKNGESVVKYPRLNKQINRALKLTYLN